MKRSGFRDGPSKLRRAATAIAAFGALAPLSGCGGGGSGGSNGGATEPATRLLTPSTGQSWTYRLTGTITTNGIGASATGTLTTAYALPPTGSAAGTLELTTTGSLNAGILSVPLNSSETVQLDSAGDELVTAFQYGSSALETLTTPIQLVPGMFSPSFTYSSSATATGSTSPYAVTFTVVGQAVVTVPAGTFNTWKVTATIVQGTVTTTGTEYFAPEIGNFVKSTVVATDSTTPKTSASLTAELTATTVSH